MLSLNQLIPLVLAPSEAVLAGLFLSAFMRSDNITENTAAKCHPAERQTGKDITVLSLSTYSLTHLICHHWRLALFQSQRAMRGKFSELIHNTEAVTTAQLRTQKRTSKTASERAKTNGISIFQMKGRFFREIGGKVSFIITYCFKFKHSPYFSNTLHILFISQCDKIYLNIFYWNILNILFSGSRYIYAVIQPSLPSNSGTCFLMLCFLLM